MSYFDEEKKDEAPSQGTNIVDEANNDNEDSGSFRKESLDENNLTEDEFTTEDFAAADQYFATAEAHEEKKGRYVWPEDPTYVNDMRFADDSKYISRRFFAVWLIVAMFTTALLTSLVSGILLPILRNAGFDTERVSPTTYSIEKSAKSPISAEEIIAKNSPSVVEIRTEEVARDIYLNNYIKQGAGSGVVISKDGYIVTNNHVIAGAQKITVTLKNQKSYNAVLVGTDPETDLAVLKINATGLKVATLGDSTKLAMGQFVIAIGNPLGQLGGSATGGIISATNRRISLNGKEMELIQTDASINPGNSGGGLFDNFGNLVGVVVAKSAGTNVEGIGFAIPMEKAKPIIESLIKDGKLPSKPKVGIMIANVVDSSMAKEMNVPKPGVYVAQILNKSASEAGIKKGDRLVSIDGKKVQESRDFIKEVESHKVGEKVKLIVERDNKELELNVTLGEPTQ